MKKGRTRRHGQSNREEFAPEHREDTGPEAKMTMALKG